MMARCMVWFGFLQSDTHSHCARCPIFFCRCKANYAAKQWDEGVAVMFQSNEVYEVITKGRASAAGFPRPTFSTQDGVSQEVQDCIFESADRGETAKYCLESIYLGKERNKKVENYFVYEKLPIVQGRETMYIDACEVYTGPASVDPSVNVEDKGEFKKCLDNDMETQCNIPHFVWSGRSKATTPVANFHSWKVSNEFANNQNERDKIAIQELTALSVEMKTIIEAINNSFVSNPLKVELFSAEGDGIHMLMDCMFLGPYARMDYASRGYRNNLPVPSWSRNDNETSAPSRSFSLPCTPDKLKGDLKTPFTCGSEARRSVIKYFVRNFASAPGLMPGQCDTPDVNATVQDANKQRLLNVIHKRLTALYDAWSDPVKLMCQERDATGELVPGSYGFQFCDGDNYETWTPIQLNDFDTATSADVAEEIFASAPCFYKTSMDNPAVWFKNLHQDEKNLYEWSASSEAAFAARQSSLFHKHKPVVSYGDDELEEPFHNGTVSMWEMCAGLLGHVHFTMPLTKNAQGQYVPTTLKASSSYSPYAPSTTPNITSLENFILQVSRDAFEISPFYRHYGMFHLPSNSAGCPDFAAQAAASNPVLNGETYTILQEVEPGHGTTTLTGNDVQLNSINITRRGILSGLLGAAPKHSCFCGFDMEWPSNTPSPMCVLPSVIRLYIDTEDLPPTDDMAYLKNDIAGKQGGRFYLHENERVQRTLRQLWVPEIWPCPDLDVSDHWGIVRDAGAWVRSQESHQIPANDLLETGYGGLRAGTISYVLGETKRKITPAGRQGTMNPSDGTPITGQTKCEMNKPSMRGESLAGHFINDLFPAAQGKPFPFLKQKHFDRLTLFCAYRCCRLSCRVSLHEVCHRDCQAERNRHRHTGQFNHDRRGRHPVTTVIHGSIMETKVCSADRPPWDMCHDQGTGWSKRGVQPTPFPLFVQAVSWRSVQEPVRIHYARVSRVRVWFTQEHSP